MDIDTLVENAKKWLGGGRWVWIVGVAAIVVTIAIPVSLLWPVLQPKPEPQYMAVPTSTVDPSTNTAQLPATVPAEVREAIAAELGADDPTRVGVTYIGDAEHVAVTYATGPNDFKRYMFVLGEDGTWSKQ